MSAYRPTIAIVGAGASGVLAALHVLDSPGPPVRLLLVERSGKRAVGWRSRPKAEATSSMSRPLR